jgi:hypothetical protein
LLGSDLLIAFYALNHKYAPLLIFGYIAATRLLLSLSTVFFPFYCTLGAPLLQAMQNGPSVYLDALGRLTFLTKPYEQAVGLRVQIQ